MNYEMMCERCERPGKNYVYCPIENGRMTNHTVGVFCETHAKEIEAAHQEWMLAHGIPLPPLEVPTYEEAKKEADEYYAKHPEVKAQVDANFDRWWGVVKNQPPCECGLDDVTPSTCPAHQGAR